MDFHSRFIQLIADGEFETAKTMLGSIPENLVFAYRFLLDEINERYECSELLPSDPIPVKAAKIRCYYRKSGDFIDVIKKSKTLPSLDNLDSSSSIDLFWVLFNTLTMGFAYHSIGNFSKAEMIYLQVAELDDSIVCSGLLEMEARVTLMELYLDVQNENAFFEQERRFLGLLDVHPNAYLRSIFLISKSEWTYFHGQYIETLSLLKEAGDLLSEIKQHSYSGRVFARQGRLFQEFGEFDNAIIAFDQAMEQFSKVEGHFIEKAFLHKARSKLKFQFGEIEQAKQDLFKALDLISHSNNPIELGKIYFRLLELGYSTKDFDFGEMYYLKLETLCQKPNTKQLVPYLEFGKFLRYRSQDRLIPFSRALGLLQNLANVDDLPFILKLYSQYELLVMYITELLIFFNEDVLKDINRTFSSLLDLSKSFPSKFFEIKLLLLKARFSIIVHDASMAEEYISEAYEKAIQWGIPTLIEAVKEEQRDLIQKAKASELFVKAFNTTNIAEELRHSEIREYLDLVKKIIQAYG